MIMKKTKSVNPNLIALLGLTFSLPFLFLNAIIGNRIEPIFSFIRPDIHTSQLEYLLLLTSVSLLPIGGAIAIRPVFQKTAGSNQKIYLLNYASSLVLFILFALLVIGLGSDIYKCDILKIPNCD
jgi:hypothetical protein